MSGFDRSQWKAAPLAATTQVVAETKQFDTYFGGNGDYAPFWKQREGVTIKRVLPAHEMGDSPYVPMLSTMLKIEQDDKDANGNVIGKKISNKKIFIGTLHGGFKYDIIEEYIRRVYAKAEAYQGDEKDRFLNPITGYRTGGKNGVWVPGIRPQLDYTYYALIEGEIYRDSLKPKQMEALNKESADLCAQNNTAAVDMFSDPDTGFPIQWSRSKDDKGKWVDTLKSLPLKVHQTWDDFFVQNAVSDAVLEKLSKLPSLKTLYVDSYKKRDFDLALEGLKRFDEANVYKIFADEEYLDMVEEMAKLVEEKTGDTGKPSGTDDLPFGTDDVSIPTKTASVSASKTVAKKAVAKKKAEPTPEEKLRVVNEEFVRQYGDEYDELELDGEELEEAYQLAINKEDLEYDIPHIPGWDKQEAPVPVETAPAPAPKAVVVPENAETDVAAPNNAVARIRALQEKRKKLGGK